MIPIRDTLSSRNVPVVNTGLILINILIFLLEKAQGPELDRFIYYYGLVPARYFVPQIAAYFSIGQQVFAFFSFMFLHGGFLHLLFNMWSLYIFGDNIEDRLGSLRYLAFYILCGLASGAVHMLLNPTSNVPTIGASGAIAGVMGAYLLLFPGSKVLTLIPIIIIPWFVEIPAFFFLGLWFLMQLFNAAGDAGSASGIAWWAHIGGFLFGMLSLVFFKRVPSVGASERVRRVTAKKRSHRLQVIRPVPSGDDAHLYGVLAITAHEAAAGTLKLVNIPWGFQKRLVRVQVPAGVGDGKILRLRGMGQITPAGGRGDLLLKVTVSDG
ncbi:MAG: rhomboid family intramembrane serine protease [Desulfosarcinaceae bacterium]|nr:rhomboid family intramembrane serine protease [Desulfosarcinaceae bacterium]